MQKIIKKYDSFFFMLPIVSSLALVLRAFLPFAFLIVGIAITIFGVYYLINFSVKEIIERITISVKKAWLFFLIATILLVALLFTQIKTRLIEVEVFQVSSMLVVCVSFFLISFHKSLSFIKRNFINLFLVYIVFIIIYSLYRLIFTGYSFYLFSSEVDFNMAAMFLIMTSIIIVCQIGFKVQNKWKVLLYNIFLVMITFIILILASRRGIIVLSALISLLLLGLILKKYRSKSKQLAVYLSILFSVLLMSFILFINNNFRHYLLTNINSPSLSLRLESTAAKYYSIFGGDSKAVDFFSPPFIFGKIQKKKIISDYKHTKDLNSRYKSINELALYTNSKDELISYIPYAANIPDSVFLKTNLTNLPITYNVDYNFEYSFLPLNFGNCVLANYDSNKNTLTFKSLDSGDNSRLLSFLPVSDSSRFTLEFDFLSTSSIPQFNILDFNSQPFSSIIEDTIISIDSIKYKKILTLDIFKRSADRIRFEIDFNYPELVISGVQWRRRHLSKEIVYSPLNNVIQKKELYQNRISAIYKVYNTSDIESVNTDSFFLFHDKIVKYQKIKKYARCKIDSSTGNYVTFQTTGKRGAVMKIVPTIPDQTYYVSYKTNIHPDNLFYKIGRYPQVQPYYTKLKDRVFKIEKVEDLYLVKDTFRVEDCPSLLSSLVIGSKIIQDSVLVSDLKYVLFKKNRISNLTNQQKRRSNSFFKLGEIAEKHYATTIQDSLLKYYKFEKHQQQNKLLSSRLLRWQFAYKYFKEYSFVEKIIGRRLEYLSVYHKVFNTKADYDYPHNPIISAFLYSGILGGLLYICFLGLSFYRYWKLRKELLIFAIMYTVSFVFAFFSTNSHFSIPAFALLSFIPFLIKKDME